MRQSKILQKRVRRRPIYHDVDRAPYKLGAHVRVIGSKDETFDPRYKGRIGTVDYLEYQCGCGQSYPVDPMIGVKFHDNAVEEFWMEELARPPFRGRKRRPRSLASSKKRTDRIRQSRQ